MIHWKYSLNFVVNTMAAVWCFILIRYLNYTENNCNLDKNKENFRKTSIIITWIVFGILVMGALLSLLEFLGIIPEMYKLVRALLSMGVY